ncbi:oligosaccharide flippase family protein [Shewanella aegiceratis]|uniref:oligosaccharide flippase family protein n=1 Tax=Shewanella aegiceratis TaxID=2864203 RepID=UPI001C661B20|nr:oligosaccharide flippase family protein [Shewanella aegiceratis]QYJ83756.1 oligosaccharide flippase family protein [Shewanella aegiceratis]
MSNYLSQIYVALIGILLLPLYVKYMGTEAYGLVGFYSMLQAWFSLLDMGLTPTIGRETARYNGGAVSSLAYRQLYRALSVLFALIAVFGGGAIFLFSGPIASKWLNVAELSLDDVIITIQIISIIVSLRWMSGLYKGVITGFEKLVFLSAFNASFATFRFVFVFISMWFFGYTPIVFFVHQLIVAILEQTFLFSKTRELLPVKSLLKNNIGWSISPIKPVLKFSITIALTASIWVFVTQTDKLILSGILSLADYGYFSLAVLVANGIVIISGPVSSAILPRLSKLHAENNRSEFLSVYRKSTQLVSVVTGSVAVTLIISARPLLIAWTGDIELAEKSAQILRLYSAGNLFLSLSAFAYYLQYAKGNLKYHLIGNILLVVILIPSVIHIASLYGAIGAGYVWFFVNFFYFSLWVSYIHYKLEPNLFRKWLGKDILTILIPTLGMSLSMFFLINRFFGESEDRLSNFIFVFVIALFSMFTAVFFSGKFRQVIKSKLFR